MAGWLLACLPACLSACLPASLLACLPARLLARQTSIISANSFPFCHWWPFKRRCLVTSSGGKAAFILPQRSNSTSEVSGSRGKREKLALRLVRLMHLNKTACLQLVRRHGFLVLFSSYSLAHSFPNQAFFFCRSLRLFYPLLLPIRYSPSSPFAGRLPGHPPEFRRVFLFCCWRF